ncbi:hypothetical protein [Paenibacillus illinoisensis]|uniref:hypothetical protein n=1 Tax=Paenibacillus illinoisensis TaxID=59845 RepID=UPI0030198674
MSEVSYPLFILSSMILGLGTFRIIFSLFRFKFTRYFPEILSFLFVNYSLFYYTLYYPELAKGFNAIYVLIVCAFLMFVVKIPFFWSIFLGILGSAGAVMGQLFVTTVSKLFYHVAPIYLWTDPTRYYLYCILTGLINYLFAWLFYRRGFGFTFELDRPLRKIEKIGVGAFILIMFLIVRTVILDESKPSHIALHAIVFELVFLLSFAIWKEKTNH